MVGAGLSVEHGFPLEANLETLLWAALEADAGVLDALQRKLGIDALTAKETMRHERGSYSEAWKAVGQSPVARRLFQQGFATLDRQRRGSFSAAHDALARMVHRGNLTHVVSLNWDTKLEAAWTARYGQEKTLGDRLFKPHGDAAHPEEEWVLPGDVRPLPAQLIEQLEALAEERPRLLLVAGYSEGDEHVMREIIAPLEERWHVARVGPDAHGDLAARGTAEQLLPQLLDVINPAPEAPGWAFASFEPHHDLAWALSGRRLGTHDVNACPDIAEVPRIVSELEATGASTIIAPSGTGKSLAAAQAAHALWSEGAEVVELEDPQVDAEELRQGLIQLPRPVVAIIDDAQRLRSAQRETLERSAGEGLYVIAVLNEADQVTPGVRLNPRAAVERLAAHIRQNQKALLPVVSALDSHVGDGYLDEPILRRLRQAEEAAKTPWQLTFILTGGWRRVSGELAELYQEDGHDLVVALVAVGQLLHLDGSPTPDDLLKMTHAAGRNSEWLSRATEAAIERRLLVTDLDTLRLPHLRFAEAVLASSLKGDGRDRLLRAVRDALAGEHYRLAGVAWLLRDLRFAENSHYRRKELLDEATARNLAARSLRSPNAEVGSASLILNELDRDHPAILDLAANAGLLADWVSSAEPDSMSGLSRLLNDTYQRDRDAFMAICRHVNVPRLLNAFESCEWPDPYFYGKLFDRLGLGPEAFRKQLSAQLDRGKVRKLFAEWITSKEPDLYIVVQGIRGIGGIDYDFALGLIEELAPSIGERWRQDFASGYGEMMDILLLLGLGPDFLRAHKPRGRERRIVRKICAALDGDEVAAQVSRSERRQWRGVGEGLILIAEVSPVQAEKIAQRVDLSKLDASTARFWATRFAELHPLLIGLARSQDNEPAASWLERHLDDIQYIDTLAVQVAPGPCVRRLQKSGATVDLRGSTLHWGPTAAAISIVARIDLDLARRSVAAHAKGLAESFVGAKLDDSSESLVTVLTHVAPKEFSRALGSLPPGDARKSWTDALTSRRRGPCRAVALLLDVALERETPLRDVANELRARFPVASKSPSETQTQRRVTRIA
ncbi:MAG TPA: hypothetical protein VFY04_00245 [Solirubrobacterales bacterium]|nr:hypothetical protein [Solirubrobacterales bacterium]